MSDYLFRDTFKASRFKLTVREHVTAPHFLQNHDHTLLGVPFSALCVRFALFAGGSAHRCDFLKAGQSSTVQTPGVARAIRRQSHSAAQPNLVSALVQLER